VKTAVQEVVSIFENKMLPALKVTDGITAEIRDFDGKIDMQVSRIKDGMDKVVASLEKEMTLADELFQSTVVIADITRDIAGINEQVNHVGDASNQILANAQGLSALALRVKNLMDKFKV